MYKLLILAGLLAYAPPGGPHVTKLLRETVSLYDAGGTLLRRVPRSEAPKDLKIVGRNAAGQIGVRWGGEIVYLRNSEVIAEGLADECRPTAAAALARGGNRVAAAEGVGSGMGGHSAPCVR